MVKAELSHNPYILETKVKFNGQAPKINSLIEKYQDAKLQTWIDQIPTIFYHEMNGYDFELDFSGTITDFKAIFERFLDCGLLVAVEGNQGGHGVFQRQEELIVKVGDNSDRSLQPDVSLFFKNELEDAWVKSKAVDELLAWLQATPNRRFDFAQFSQQYQETFEENYSYVCIQGALSEKFSEDITLENITNILDLPADLTNTPILFYLDEQTLPNFRDFFEKIYQRQDVNEQQLFFYITEKLNSEQIERTIQDLGIEQPQLVQTVDDLQIQRFFEIYPITDYIGEAIVIFQKQIEQISTNLTQENERSRQQNSQIREEIDQFEQMLQKLKASDELIVQRDNFEVTDDIRTLQVELVDQIHNWRKKKSQIASDEEATQAAHEYEHVLREYFATFITRMSYVFVQENLRIQQLFTQLYAVAEYDDEFTTQLENPINLSDYTFTPLAPSFLAFRKEEMVPSKDVLSALTKLFDKQEHPQELVSKVTYALNSWRFTADEMLRPAAEQVIHIVTELLFAYYDRVADDYHAHIQTLIGKLTREKEATAAKLSDEEQKLQVDNDWLKYFSDQVKAIERG